MQMVSWNCRGLGNPSKVEAIKDLLKIEPTYILMLQETTIEGELLLNTSNTKWKFDNGKAVSTRVSVGGIGTFWSGKIFLLERSYETKHWIFTELRHTSSNLLLALFNLYVPVHYAKKRECWKSLSDFLELHNPKNIVIGGDLNIIMDPKEKRGGSYTRDPMLYIVENLMLQWDLVDFKPVKGEYTWTNNRIGENRISATLDRFLTHSSIMMDRRIIFSKILPKLTSDHKPILLCLKEEEDLGPLPFRFSPLYAEREGFFETVQTAWQKEVTGSPSFMWEQKLKKCKLAEIQFDLEKTEISSLDIDKEKYAQRNTYSYFRREEEYWQIKSRSLWLKAGDRNTAYFHRQYRAHLSRNHIAKFTTSNGQVCKGFDQIKDATRNHFQTLLSAERDGCEEDINDFLTHIPNLVNADNNNMMLNPTSKNEISRIVCSMQPDKAPGPDGFSIHFYRLCWEIIKSDLLRMIHGFLRKAKVGGGINSTFLALIPKEANPGSFERYRPISLCNAS
eukprot:PITA_01699